MSAPQESVIQEFGAGPFAPVRIPGGQGTTWRAGDIVLKPLDMPAAQFAWQAQLLSEIDTNDFRVAVPLRSAAGQLVIDAWTACRWLQGHHLPQWPQILAVADRLHDAIAAVPRPALFDRWTNRWADADRVAWGEAAAPRDVTPGMEWLLEARRAVSSQHQLIHADLSGNVLFADGLPPAIIDFSPLWRPKGYASAIITVDAIAWHNASLELLDSVLPKSDREQFLIRALIYRQLSDADPTAGNYQITIEALRRRITG